MKTTSKRPTGTKPKIYINPPPRDLCCECCGRHISELKPFGGAGDPLIGDFSGALLLKTYRSMAPQPDNEWTRRSHEIEKTNLTDEEKLQKWKSLENKLIKTHGEETVKGWQLQEDAANTVGASWECRNCIILYDTDYFKLHETSFKNEKEKTP
jgi:hypothetical protein